MPNDLSKELSLAKKAVLNAGDLIMQIYNSDDFDVYTKNDNSPVTKADRLANDLTCRCLSDHFDYPIISEENNQLRVLPAGKVWVLDPLDGTKSFIEKRGEFSIMLALLQDFKPVLGLVYDVPNQTLYFAESGLGSFSQKNTTITKCEMSFNEEQTMVVSRHHLTKKDQSFAKQLGVNYFLSKSSIGLKAASLIENKASIYINFNGLNLWDIAAPYLLVKEAGGVICDKQSKDLFERNEIPLRFENGVFIVHQKFREILTKNL